MNNFPVFHPPKLCYFLKFLIVRYFFFVFHVVTLAILLVLLAVVVSNFKLLRFSLGNFSLCFSGIYFNCFKL